MRTLRGLWRRAAVAAAAGALAACRTHALDGMLVTVRYELGGMGNIHDTVTPGRLMLYEIRGDRVAGSRALCDGANGLPTFGPFGDRVAFSRPDGTVAVVSVEGGPVTELVSSVGDEKPDKPVDAAVQWPAGDGGRWIYYMDCRGGGRNNALRRVNVQTRADEQVVRFNRPGVSCLSPDATPRSGRSVIRTDNYSVVVYDMSNGDGDLYPLPKFNPGCGVSVSPDGSMFTANNGWHTGVVLVDMSAKGRHSFRVNEWDGDPTAGVTDRRNVEWAWQHHRWSPTSMGWIAVTQGRLSAGSTHEVRFMDSVLYDWVAKRQINVTRNPGGAFDRAGGFWEKGVRESFLGYFGGEAPFTVEIGDARLRGRWRWDFGDGARAVLGASGRHTYGTGGVYEVAATRGRETFRGQVTVSERQAPSAKARFVDAGFLLVDFDEPVAAEGSRVRLEGGGAVAKWSLTESARRMLVTLEPPLLKDGALRISGVRDLAQEPNALADEPLEVAVPAWPSDRSGVVWLWENASSVNAVRDGATGALKEMRAFRDQGRAGFDRRGRMRLDGGRLNTGFFSQARAQMDFAPVVKADAFTLELTLRPADLKQRIADGTEISGSGRKAGAELRLPPRIVNVSAWYDADWEFFLGQEEERLVFSIRTSDNMLTCDGRPTKGDLHGRAPVYEIARLPDALPRHVAVTYSPGRLAAYLDGERVFESGEVTGSLASWGYGELCFGDNHNGGRHRWRGRIDGVAIYRRALGADEVRRNFAARAETIASYMPLPRVEVEAVLRAVSAAPDPAKIAPYVEALVVNEYEVRRVLKVSDGCEFAADARAGARIRVAQWGVVDRERTELAKARPGDVRRLVLEAYDGHPDRLDQLPTSDGLDFDADVPLFHEPAL